ncbi:hypothetical protein [Borreliella lusitaniae]
MFTLLLCCTTIANLPEEPNPPIIQTLESLAKYVVIMTRKGTTII